VEDVFILGGLAMTDPQPPAPSQPDGSPAPTREQRMQLLHDELIKLNAQLEYLRLMLRLRRPQS
jgi:hypothetical protein